MSEDTKSWDYSTEVKEALDASAKEIKEEIDAEIIEAVVEEAEAIDAPEPEKPVVKKKRKYKKRAPKVKTGAAVEPKKSEPKPEPVAIVKETVTVTPDYTYKAWWGEVGSVLAMRGYSCVGLCNRAKKAFGAGFNQAKYDAYITSNDIKSVGDKVEGIWISQK